MNSEIATQLSLGSKVHFEINELRNRNTIVEQDLVTTIENQILLFNFLLYMSNGSYLEISEYETSNRMGGYKFMVMDGYFKSPRLITMIIKGLKKSYTNKSCRTLFLLIYCTLKVDEIICCFNSLNAVSIFNLGLYHLQIYPIEIKHLDAQDDDLTKILNNKYKYLICILQNSLLLNTLVDGLKTNLLQVIYHIIILQIEDKQQQ